MKKLLLTSLSILFSNTLVYAALDDILVPKITWEQLKKIYDSQNTATQASDEINHLIHQTEMKYGIPHGLLSAIAYTESGRHIADQKNKVIWPWTVNANGRSYYLKNKSEAIATVQRLRRSGIKVIDVGCMQVNLVYHGNAFKSLDEAFIPKVNIEYAAKLLRSLYNSEKSWDKAVCYYHSKTKERYSKYYSKIMSAYKRTSKVQIEKKEIPFYTLCKNTKNVHVQRKSLDDIIAERLHKIGKNALANERVNQKVN